ncbi:MAG: rRNA adenine dimethyltransferase family protein, partial [Bacteroidota bacterium]
FMIQKEVAERICANEGSKTYGILSVLLGAYFERSYEFSVPPHVFRPPPKVQSGVIRLVRKEALPTVAFSKLKRLVKAAFNQRRKTLRNALKSVPMQEFPDQEVILKLRAEQLPIEKFVELANYME